MEMSSKGRQESIQTRMIFDSPLGEVISKALGKQVDLSHAEVMPFPTPLDQAMERSFKRQRLDEAETSTQTQIQQHAL